MEGAGDTHDIRRRRKGDIVDCLVRMYSTGWGIVPTGLLRAGPSPYSSSMRCLVWDRAMVHMGLMGTCGPKQNLGGT